jgi:hypothetical protein
LYVKNQHLKISPKEWYVAAKPLKAHRHKEKHDEMFITLETRVLTGSAQIITQYAQIFDDKRLNKFPIYKQNYVFYFKIAVPVYFFL